MTNSSTSPHGTCRSAIRELGPQLLDVIDDISELKPRLEAVLGGAVLDRLSPGDLEKTEQAVIIGGFLKQVVPRIIVGTSIEAQFNKNAPFYVEPMQHILTQPRRTREYLFGDALHDMINNPARHYFREDTRWLSVDERYFTLYRERRKAGHDTMVKSMLEIIPPADYTEGVPALIRLVNGCDPSRQQSASERQKITQDLVYLLGAKASQHASLELESSKVDTLEGEIDNSRGRNVFKCTNADTWKAVFPQGHPPGLVTKCFAHQLFAGQKDTNMIELIHAGITYASAYNLFTDTQ